MGVNLGAIGKVIGPMISKAASNFIVNTVQNKTFGNSGVSSTANSGAFSAGAATAGVQEAAAIMINKQSNNASIPLHFGRRRLGGTRVFADTTNKAGSTTGTEYLNMAFVISEGGEHGTGWPTKMYFDDKVIWDIDQSGTLDYSAVTSGTIDGVQTAQLKNFEDGGTTSIGTETTSEILVYWAPGHLETGSNGHNWPQVWQDSLGSSVWTNNHKLTGLTVCYIILQANPEYYEGGLPQITFECDGLRLTPIDGNFITASSHSYYTSNAVRTDSQGANPVDVLYYYLTDPMNGKALDFDYATGQYAPGQDIDLVSFVSARSYCESTVYRNSQSQRRYTMNGIINTDATLYDNIDMLVNSFNGMLIYTNGKYRLKIRKPNEQSVFSFNKDNILGDIDVLLSGDQEKLNRLSVSYSSPDTDYQDDLHTEFVSSYLTKDNYKILERKVDMPLITEIELIKELARYKIDTSRNNITVTFVAPHTALTVECGEIIDLTHEMFNFTAKKFRVLQVEILADNTVSLVATEYDSGIEI